MTDKGDMTESHQTEFTVWERTPGLHLGYLIFDAETVRRRFDEQELERWDEWLVRGNC